MNLRNLSTVAASCAVFCSAAKVVAAETNEWSFDIVPYLWVAGVQINTTLPDVPVSAPPGASRFETKITGGALCAAQINYRSFGLWVDFDWLRTKTEPNNPGPAYSGGDLTANFYQSTAALTYELPLEGPFHTKLLAGAQLWSVSEDLNLSAGALPGVSTSDSRTWVNPVIGADLRYELGKGWSLVAKGTFTVLDGNSDANGWDAMGGVAYRFSNLFSMALGYRYLHEEYKRSTFDFNTDIQGVILGFGFHF